MKLLPLLLGVPVGLWGGSCLGHDTSPVPLREFRQGRIGNRRPLSVGVGVSGSLNCELYKDKNKGWARAASGCWDTGVHLLKQFKPRISHNNSNCFDY